MPRGWLTRRAGSGPHKEKAGNNNAGTSITRARAFGLVALAALAGCGGSNPFFVVEEPFTLGPEPAGPGLSSTGYAQAGDQVASNTDVLAPNTKFIRQTSSGLSTRTEDIRVTISPNANQVYLTIGGVSELLTLDGAVYVSTDNQTQLDREFFFKTGDARAVQTISILDVNGTTLDTAFLAIGYDTDPTEVNAQTGSATYRAGLDLYFATPSGAALLGDDSGQIQVNFDANTISGTFNVTPASLDLNIGAPLITIPEATVTFNSGGINGNTFSGSAAITFTGTGIAPTVSDLDYDGRFYGADAAAVGGQVTGSGTSGGEQLIVNGTFVGAK